MEKGAWVAMVAASVFVAGCKKQPPGPIGETARNTNAQSLISGRVVFKGTAPPPKTLALDALCGKLHSVPPTESDFQIGASNGLSEVVVYLKGVPAGDSQTAPTNTPVLDQKGCVYVPRVFGVMVNQKFRVRNSDPLLHTVHAVPKN